MIEATGTVQDAISDDAKVHRGTSFAGISVCETTVRRAIASVLESLGLSVSELSEKNFDDGGFSNFELLVADQDAAEKIRPYLDAAQSKGQAIKPALVAIGSRLPDHESSDFDAFIALPSMWIDMAARLSVVLYSHRALGSRYKSALEELSLNRNIFRSVTNGISVANAQLPDLPLMYVNPAFELMTGYSLEEIEGKNCRFLQKDDRDQPGLTLIREAIAQQRQTVAIVRNYRKDGSCFWNELTISPVRNADGELTHFVGIQLDVTERVRIEGALRESEKLAAVGRLASSISHEINNPLEAVMNLVYLAQNSIAETPENKEALSYLGTAEEELQRTKLIASQSLKFSRQTSRPQAVLINEVVGSVLDIYKARLRNYGVTVECRMRSNQHVVIFQSELRQVLSNLVNNSVDALKNGRKRVIAVRTREATDWRADRNGVLITISDCGGGIPLDVQRKLFTAFYSTKGMQGNGLGLWISKGIIDRHHGTIKLRSRVGEGQSYTTFEIFLPFQAATGDGDKVALNSAGDNDETL